MGKDLTISEIESLSYEGAKALSQESMDIKGHECFFVDFGGYFGYSVLVYKDKKHIYYANDYQLHHQWLLKENGGRLNALKDFYIQSLNNKLFRDEELLGEVHSYDEYTKKIYFLHNYWIMRYDYVSIFAISEEDRKKVEDGKKTHPYFSHVGFCYVSDQEIINKAKSFDQHLKWEYEKLKKNNSTFKEMIAYELANHEACITCNPEEALDALGLTWSGLTDEQRDIVNTELERQIHNYACQRGEIMKNQYK